MRASFGENRDTQLLSDTACNHLANVCNFDETMEQGFERNMGFEFCNFSGECTNTPKDLMVDPDGYDGTIRAGITAQSAYRNLRKASKLCLEQSPLGRLQLQKANLIPSLAADESRTSNINFLNYHPGAIINSAASDLSLIICLIHTAVRGAAV